MVQWLRLQVAQYLEVLGPSCSLDHPSFRQVQLCQTGVTQSGLEAWRQAPPLPGPTSCFLGDFGKVASPV